MGVNYVSTALCARGARARALDAAVILARWLLVVVGRRGVFELLSCHLSTDEPCDLENRLIDADRSRDAAIIVRGRRCIAAVATLILNHRRAPPETIPRIRGGIAARLINGIKPSSLSRLWRRVARETARAMVERT
jgi:hypothetical protein